MSASRRESDRAGVCACGFVYVCACVSVLVCVVRECVRAFVRLFWSV